MKFKDFHDFHNSHMEFYDFHDFRNSQMEFNDFHDFHYSRVDSRVNIANNFMILICFVIIF